MTAVTQAAQALCPPVYGAVREQVAAYCRVSTRYLEQDSSVENQIRHYRALIASRPDWAFAGIYCDRLSGTSIRNRSGLQSLLADCRAGKVSLILTKSISRFARNLCECLELVRMLSKLNVHLYFEKENIHTGTMESEFLLSILAALAEDESRSISKNVKWGIHKRFLDGSYKPARAPYGYRKTDGVMAVREEEAEIVRRIFREVLGGAGSTAIARSLNRDKIPTCWKAREWDAKTVRMIVRSPVYVGDAIYQKTFRDQNFRQRVNRGQMDMYLCTDHHPAIVSRETFRLANDVLSRRNRGDLPEQPHARPSRSCFTGKIICGRCGGKMYRGAANHGTQPFFRCHTHGQNPAACGMKNVREDNIKHAFLTMLNKLAFSQSLPREQRVLDTAISDAKDPEMAARARELRRFLRDWQVTGRTEDFPETLFRETVDRAVVVTGEQVAFHLSCGLMLTESI